MNKLIKYTHWSLKLHWNAHLRVLPLLFLEEFDFQDPEEAASSIALKKELRAMHSLVDKLQGDITQMK